jgi:hypothetical protein
MSDLPRRIAANNGWISGVIMYRTSTRVKAVEVRFCGQKRLPYCKVRGKIASGGGTNEGKSNIRGYLHRVKLMNYEYIRFQFEF